MINSLMHFAAACKGGTFLGFPAWYSYLDSQKDAQGKCTPVISGINDVWLIVPAIIEILLRIAAIAAVIFIIYGGVQYITSQGSPDDTRKARNTIINALIGLALAVMASMIIAFIAGSINAK